MFSNDFVKAGNEIEVIAPVAIALSACLRVSFMFN